MDIRSQNGECIATGGNGSAWEGVIAQAYDQDAPGPTNPINSDESATAKSGQDPEKHCNCGNGAKKDEAEASTLKGGTEATTLKTGTESTLLKTGTESTLLKTATESTLLKTGTESTLLKTGTESTLLQGGTKGTLIKAGVDEEGGPLNVEIIYDCSGSMGEGFGKTTKIEAAKDVFLRTLKRIPKEVNVGLREFGMEGADCTGSRVLVPMGTGNRRFLSEAVKALEPNGITPWPYALKETRERDLRNVYGRRKVIIISDGADTCGGDPCKEVRKMLAEGIKVKIDVVKMNTGFSPRANSQLDCLAKTTGGKTYNPKNTKDLMDSFDESINEAVSGKVTTQINKAKNIETPIEMQPIKPLMDHSLDGRAKQ